MKIIGVLKESEAGWHLPGEIMRRVNPVSKLSQGRCTGAKGRQTPGRIR